MKTNNVVFFNYYKAQKLTDKALRLMSETTHLN